MILFATFVTFSAVKFGFETVVVSALPLNGKIILIDAGHGQPDGGAVGVSGLSEESLNLDVALKLQQLLEQSGAYVVMTRTDNNSVAENLDDKIRNIKLNDMKTRKYLRDNSDCDIFVSIHMNKFEQQKYKGAQVFYSATGQNSKILAESIQNRIVTLADKSNTRIAKQADKGIYLLKNAPVASVIAECGFLSNPEEEKKLSVQEYREQLAYAVYHGISDYFAKIQNGG